MPPFAMPDETGHLVSLDDLLEDGPLAMTFHRGHWCPYCRINTRALARAQAQIASDGGRLAAIMPELQQFAATFKAEGEGQYPVLTDIDNGYALSLNLAIWVGEEMQQILEAGGRNVPDYQGNQAWVMPIPGNLRHQPGRDHHCTFHRPRLPQAHGRRGSAGGTQKCRGISTITVENRCIGGYPSRPSDGMKRASGFSLKTPEILAGFGRPGRPGPRPVE